MLRLAVEIASGLNFLHEFGVLHRDVKGSNILLDKTQSHAKVADFGLSLHLDDLGCTQGSTVGTLRYLAPEVSMKAEWSTACDVYSFGLLLFEMLHGELAFSHLSSMQSAMATAAGILPQLCLPSEFKPAENLLRSCWMMDASKRATVLFVKERLCALLESAVPESVVESIESNESILSEVRDEVPSPGSVPCVQDHPTSMSQAVTGPSEH